MGKKMLSMVLAVLMLLVSAAFAEGTVHTHAPAEGWERNLKQHWRACECGEKLDAEDHVFAGGRCTACGSEVWEFEDGSGEIYNFDEYGSVIRITAYNAEGLVETDYHYVLEYSEGFCTREEIYLDEMLVSVTEYAMHEEGYGFPTLQISYYEDGNKLWEKKYDVISGRLKQESSYEILIEDDEEQHYEKFFTYYEEDGSKFVYESDVHGNELSETIYNAKGEIETVYRSEYEFDENGNVLLHNRYENERLYLVVQYEIIETEEWFCHYPKIRTEIYADGSMYIREYGEDGNELSAGLFDKDGNSLPEELPDDE